VREPERKRRMIAMNTFAYPIRLLVTITTFDVVGGQRDVFADADQKTDHSVVLEAVAVKRIVRISRAPRS
jgi:hypothetical protein